MATRKWRGAPMQRREHPHVTASRNVGYIEAMAGRPIPELQAGIPAAPKKRAPRQPHLGPTEHQEQVAVIKWWNGSCGFYGLPHFSLFAVPNGGARDPITGARLKAEGVRSGALDLILAKPSKSAAGLFLEMKVGDNRPSDNQKAFIEYLQGAGYTATVHWSAESAINAIKEYLA